MPNITKLWWLSLISVQIKNIRPKVCLSAVTKAIYNKPASEPPVIYLTLKAGYQSFLLKRAKFDFVKMAEGQQLLMAFSLTLKVTCEWSIC